MPNRRTPINILSFMLSMLAGVVRLLGYLLFVELPAGRSITHKGDSIRRYPQLAQFCLSY